MMAGMARSAGQVGGVREGLGDREGTVEMKSIVVVMRSKERVVEVELCGGLEAVVVERVGGEEDGLGVEGEGHRGRVDQGRLLVVVLGFEGRGVGVEEEEEGGLGDRGVAGGDVKGRVALLVVGGHGRVVEGEQVLDDRGRNIGVDVAAREVEGGLAPLGLGGGGLLDVSEA